MLSRYIDNFDYSSRFRILKGGKISLVVSALLGSAIIASAAPTGGVITSGTATISQSGNVTNINQSTQKASINWQGFSINSNETVNFNQPNVNSITLNRVVGNERSIIDGALNANGQVWILNSNGVLFNKNAKVNTAGLVATTKNISDKDFQDGNYKFSGDSSASVVNMGTIEVSDNGYVALLANKVSNDGTIKAYKGTVHLTGASEATINLNGNSIVSLTVNKGILDALVENKGAVIADGGKIYLTTNAVDEILKGVVNNTGVLEANSIDDIAGKIEVFAHGGTANVSGTIEAIGGFVETSGKNLSVADGTVVKAKKWLIDPTNVIVDDIANGGTISAATIGANLSSSATGEIEIQADSGDITVNQAINIWTENNAGYTVGGLTLTAGKDININSIITVGPEAYLALNYGWNGETYTGSNGADIYGHGGKIAFGMNADKTDFTGKIAFAPNTNVPGSENSTIYINDVEQNLIRNISELQALSLAANGGTGNSSDQANALTGNYVLAADINMNGQSWTPIGKYKYSNDGTDYSLDFKGHFNGLGHTISNLTMNGEFTYNNGNGQAAGLFGNIATTANISSVRLSNASVTNTYAYAESNRNKYTAQTAALVGAARDNSALIENNPTTSYLQPIIHNNIVTISNIKSTGDGSDVGAIVGAAQGAIISGNAVYAPGIIANGSVAGGIVGYAGNSTITNNYVKDASIVSRLGNVGGIVGKIYHTTIDGAFVSGSLIYATDDTYNNTTGFMAGGIVGVAEEGSKIKNSAVETSTIVALQDAGGIVGKLADNNDDLEGDEPSTVSNSFYELMTTGGGSTYIGTSNASAAQNIVTLGALDRAEYTAWKNGGKVAPTAESLFGPADVNGYYTINNNADFRKLLALAYDPTVKVKLASSFTLDSGFYLPMFKGIIDGTDKTITGLSVSQGYNSYIGLVGRLMGGAVKNLTLSGVILDGYAYVGGVAGYTGGGSYTIIDGEAQYSNFSTISNVTVNNFVYSHTKEFTPATQNMNTYTSNIGAIAGYAEGTTLSDLTATGSISSTITANNNGDDDAGFENIGGLFGGLSNSTLDTGSSSVTISSNLTSQTNNDGVNAYNIGGIAGSVFGSVFKNITASGDITMNITNNGSADISDVGGAFGYIDSSYIKTANTTNNISIIGNGDIGYVAGLAGESQESIFDTLSTSGAITVTAGNSEIYGIAGLIGYSDSDIIKNATSTRNVTISADNISNVGGLVGESNNSNIDTVSHNGTLDLSAVNSGESVGGLVGYNSGEIRSHEYYAPFSKTLVGADADAKAALLETYNSRADVVALLALGYTIKDNSWGNDGQPYQVSFYMKSPDNTEWGVIKNSTATVNIKAPNIENVGGLVGNMDAGDGGQIINSNALALNDTSKVLGGSKVGGIIGYNSYSNITDLHTAIEVVGSINGDGYVGGLVGYNEGGSRRLYQSTEIQSSYTINELTFAHDQNGYTSAQAKLTEIHDVYIAAMRTANPGFEMSYDGLYVGDNSSNYVIGGYLELVKEQPTGVITNSYATGKVTGSSNVGGLVGYNYGENGGGAINNSYATGVISGTNSVGGLVGYDEGGTIDRTYSTGTVNGADSVGGLVGYASGTEITNSYHTTGKVTALETSDGGAGGLVGGIYDRGTIIKSYATSEVVGEMKVGGLVGITDSSTIEESYTSGKVTGNSSVGGFAGLITNGDINNVYANGDISASGNNVGGLIGEFNGVLINSYASGKINQTGTNQSNVKGLIGTLTDQALIRGNFYNSTKNVGMADEVYGKTTAQMNLLATYTTDLGSDAWDIVVDSSLTKMFPQFASSGSIWKMNPVATIDPGTAYQTSEPVVIKPVIETNKDVDKVITSITNQQQVNVKLPTIVTDVKIANNIVTPSISSSSITNNSLSSNNSFATNMFKKLDVSAGESLSLVSTPVEGVVSEKITMNDLQSLKNSPASDSNNVNGSSEVRVSLGNGSIVELVNGGVTLPTGVEQEFYVQKTDSKNNNGAN